MTATPEHWIARCRVESEGDCLIWAGSVQKANGRPQATFQQKRVSPQREIYRATFGVMPDEKYVYMTCRSPLCMNVNHMQLMTRAAYFRRLSEDGELRRGAAFSLKGRRNALLRRNCRLKSIEDAREIRAEVAAGKCRHNVAAAWGITKNYVDKLIAQVSWRESSPWQGLA